MFFVVSKVLYVLIQPLNWVVALSLSSLFLKSKKWKRITLLSSVTLLVFFTNHFILNQVMNLWEPESIQAKDISEPYDIGILLGGYSDFNIQYQEGRYNFSARANRFTQTLELYKQGKIKKLLLTGGAGNLLEEQVSEAEKIVVFLEKMGVPAEDLIIEGKSRNTKENAEFTGAILKANYPGARCLLITSAWHMRRSMACFKKENIAFTPYCVDYESERTRMHPESLFTPNNLGFYRWELMIKEWFGMLGYWARGYI